MKHQYGCICAKSGAIHGVPQHTTVLNDDTIVIGEDFLALCCEKGFTMLRDELYRRLRFIAKRREANGNLDWSMAIHDALSFSMALLLLDGNQLPCPNDMMQTYSLKVL